jgi:predicted dehydrogenase
MAKLRIAVAGCGKHAHGHMRSVSTQAERVEVVAVVDVDEEKARAFAEQYSVPHYYTDMDALLQAQTPDLMIISTPPGNHPQNCRQALEAGTHVWCEKPLAGSLAQLDQIEAVARRTGRYCSSVLQWRFGSSGQHVKRLIEQGELGQPRLGICQTTWYRTPDYYAVPWRGKWATELGGVSMTLGIHAMDFFLWLMGEWDEVSAMIGTLDRDIEVENISLAHIRFGNGAMASVINSALSPHQESYIRIDCQKATVELKHLYQYSNDAWTFTPVSFVTQQRELERWQTMPDDKPASLATQFASVLDAMEAGTTPWPGLGDVRQTIEFLTCMYKSASTGRPVTRGSILQDDPFYYHMNGRC